MTRLKGRLGGLTGKGDGRIAAGGRELGWGEIRGEKLGVEVSCGVRVWSFSW